MMWRAIYARSYDVVTTQDMLEDVLLLYKRFNTHAKQQRETHRRDMVG